MKLNNIERHKIIEENDEEQRVTRLKGGGCAIFLSDAIEVAEMTFKYSDRTEIWAAF